jgi:hypothetical protein
MHVRYKIQLGESLPDQTEALCPHCASVLPLRQHRLLGKIQGVPLKSIVLVCPECEGVSRSESPGKRTFSAIVTIPFLAVLTVGAGTGLYFLGTMLFGVGRFSGGFAGIAAILVSVCGYFGFRTARFGWRLLRSNDPIPLTHLQTKM